MPYGNNKFNISSPSIVSQKPYFQIIKIKKFKTKLSNKKIKIKNQPKLKKTCKRFKNPGYNL